MWATDFSTNRRLSLMLTAISIGYRLWVVLTVLIFLVCLSENAQAACWGCGAGCEVCTTRAEAYEIQQNWCANYKGGCGCFVEDDPVSSMVMGCSYYGTWNGTCTNQTSCGGLSYLTACPDPTDPCCNDPNPCCGNPDPCCGNPNCDKPPQCPLGAAGFGGGS